MCAVRHMGMELVIAMGEPALEVWTLASLAKLLAKFCLRQVGQAQSCTMPSQERSSLQKRMFECCSLTKVALLWRSCLSARCSLAGATRSCQRLGVLKACRYVGIFTRDWVLVRMAESTIDPRTTTFFSCVKCAT